MLICPAKIVAGNPPPIVKIEDPKFTTEEATPVKLAIVLFASSFKMAVAPLRSNAEEADSAPELTASKVPALIVVVPE